MYIPDLSKKWSWSPSGALEVLELLRVLGFLEASESSESSMSSKLSEPQSCRSPRCTRSLFSEFLDRPTQTSLNRSRLSSGSRDPFRFRSIPITLYRAQHGGSAIIAGIIFYIVIFTACCDLYCISCVLISWLAIPFMYAGNTLVQICDSTSPFSSRLFYKPKWIKKAMAILKVKRVYDWVGYFFEKIKKILHRFWTDVKSWFHVSSLKNRCWMSGVLLVI